MNKHLSMILSGAACAGLITAAGLSESSAQEMPDIPNEVKPSTQGAGQSKGQLPSQAQKPVEEAQKPMRDAQQQTKERITVERPSDTAAGNIRTVTFTVKEVDRAMNTVTFQAKVSPEANIKKNGMPIKLEQLEAGDSLKIAFDPRTGEVSRAEVVRKAAQ